MSGFLEQGRAWFDAKFSTLDNFPRKIMITAEATGDPLGDIAIDDLTVSNLALNAPIVPVL